MTGDLSAPILLSLCEGPKGSTPHGLELESLLGAMAVGVDGWARMRNQEERGQGVGKLIHIEINHQGL